ncbi:hypothetical protein BN890_24890 [Bacteroides xylanisolvens SD CC 1b]|uniref:Uncharacterized protein n=1 Tax=Bacteroides xylanisolvens SD CC 1b TaxID=702447 RepID=W6P5A7_9BACE|nr:hypothetical protein BN891_16030 [Bacteroides xylanisolvens SD CC 2a]CDM04903.1 hypothetical protein BN890_24890 [Bacteroides xylanisolvens SD CC 1b]
MIVKGFHHKKGNECHQQHPRYIYLYVSLMIHSPSIDNIE